jgi:hypothetical protein
MDSSKDNEDGRASLARLFPHMQLQSPATPVSPFAADDSSTSIASDSTVKVSRSLCRFMLCEHSRLCFFFRVPLLRQPS